MRAGRKLLVIAAVIAVATAGLLSRVANLTIGLSFVAGVSLGAASFVALAARVRASTATSAWKRLLGGFLRWIYYALVVTILYLIIIVYHADVLWLLIGYTYSLTIFAIFMAQSGPQRSRRPAATRPSDQTDQEH